MPAKRSAPAAGDGRRTTADGRRSSKVRYWLLKSEPDCFSFDDLMHAPGRTTGWDGVRNYQARNFMRDDMQVGDGVLFHHSSASPPAIAGIAEVARAAYPDPTQFDAKSEYFDAKSDLDAPTWMQVDIRGVEPLARPLPLEELRRVPALAKMVLLQKGSRLSVQPVTEQEWEAVMKLNAAPVARRQAPVNR